MAMMASGTSGNFYDEDNAVLDDDFLNDGLYCYTCGSAVLTGPSRSRTR
jgi:hypothetical protein